MANSNGWGDGAANNSIGWGQGAVNNSIDWGNSHDESWAGLTDIVGGIPPSNTVAPVITGTNVVGQTLTTTNGTWTGTNLTYTYQWKRGGSNISSATSVTYVLVEADADTSVTCEVTATNSIGAASATSNSLYIFTTEYKAVLDRGTALSYTLPTTTTQQKQNKLLKSMKADGVWAKLDVFYVFAQDGGSAFGTLNWKNPNANQSTLVNSPTFVSNGGFTGNGTSSYIDTNFNPSTQGVQYTQNNASRYFFTHAISGVSAFDGIMGSNNNRMIRTSVTSQRINSGALSLPTAFDFTATVNTKSIHRTSSISVTCYNSTTGSTFVQSSAAVDNANQLVLRASTNYGAHTCAAYAMGASMISEHTNFINTWNTYKNSL
jgi:hypothetical protein